MSQDQPEAPRGQLAREAVEAYNELTAHAEELSPEAAQAVRSLRESLTSLVALGTAADLQIAEMERTMEEFEAIFMAATSPCPPASAPPPVSGAARRPGPAHHRALSG
jgi:phage shock protein A